MWGFRPSNLDPFRGFSNNRFIKSVLTLVPVACFVVFFCFVVIDLIHFPSIRILIASWILLNLIINYYLINNKIKTETPYIILLIYMFFVIFYASGFALSILGIFFSKDAVTVFLSIFVFIFSLIYLKNVIFTK